MSLATTATATTTTTTSTTGGGCSPSCSPEVLQNCNILIDKCERMFGFVPDAMITEMLEDLAGNMPLQYYTYALDETAFAPRPSYGYMRAILRRLRSERPAPDQLGHKPAQRPALRILREQAYTQREYANTEGMSDIMREQLARISRG